MTSRVIEPESPPLRIDQLDAIRVGDSQALLELVVRAFEDAETAEGIAQRYPSAGLPAVYAAITYFLNHVDQVQEYLADRERQAGEIRSRIETRQGDQAGIRARLLCRRSQ
jgi:hypothetical protein